MTIAELLDHLDGRGLVVTDNSLIAAALAEVGLWPEDEIAT